MLKPSSLLILNHSRTPTAAKIGRLMSRRLPILSCLMCRNSAILRRAPRRAVSPEVMGAATTPRMARMLPTTPSQCLLMAVTTWGAEALWRPHSCIPPSKKKYELTAAQISATTPSVIIAPKKMGRPIRSFLRHRAISGLWVAWKPLTAPQATVMNKHGKMFCPLTPTEGARFCRPSQNSGMEGHLANRPNIIATAIKSSAMAKIG